eukprot:2373240-Prymnesium_polylepis.1
MARDTKPRRRARSYSRGWSDKAVLYLPIVALGARRSSRALSHPGQRPAGGESGRPPGIPAFGNGLLGVPRGGSR